MIQIEPTIDTEGIYMVKFKSLPPTQGNNSLMPAIITPYTHDKERTRVIVEWLSGRHIAVKPEDLIVYKFEQS